MSSVASRVSDNITSLFEENSKRKINGDQPSASFLSNIIFQFAHDRFCGDQNATIETVYMECIEERAQKSAKFKLFLYAINELKKPTPLADEEERVIKLCLSRIVNLLNSRYIDTFKKILGESIISRSMQASKRRSTLPNFIDGSSKNILDKVKTLPTVYEVLLILHNEKTSYLARTKEQTYQIIIIPEYLVNSFDIWDKNSTPPPSEITSFRKFIPILEHVLADTNIFARDGENKSSYARHMQWNEELFQRKHPDYSNYSFGKKN